MIKQLIYLQFRLYITKIRYKKKTKYSKKITLTVLVYKKFRLNVNNMSNYIKVDVK